MFSTILNMYKCVCFKPMITHILKSCVAMVALSLPQTEAQVAQGSIGT